jgi:tetratricopeptide (TPR) repeat protein
MARSAIERGKTAPNRRLRKSEKIMSTAKHRRLAIFAAGLLLSTVVAMPKFAVAVDTSMPPPPPPPAGTSTDKPASAKKAKKQKKSEQQFLNGYRYAHDLIYQKGEFAAGIAALRALGHDDHADVANLIGYASRKLGRYDDAKDWYEKALAADPNHARTWSYYGMWHAEQGNMLKAQDYLEKVRLICGSGCREYVELKGVMDGTVTY